MANITVKNIPDETYNILKKLAAEHHRSITNLVAQRAQDGGCSAYDCEFVNLARDLSVQLVTMYQKILNNFPDTALSIPEYLEKL